MKSTSDKLIIFTVLNYRYIKRVFITLVSIVLLTGFAKGQVILTLQPDATQGVDADIRTDYPNTPNGTSPDFIANAWTANGNYFTQRSLIQFDLTSIPQGATVLSAVLSLYANPTTGHTQHHSSLSGSNECYLKRIIAPWNELTVCWNNQPATTDSNKVLINQSTGALQDYPNLDVTLLVQDMVDFPAMSHGMMLMLKTESQFRCMVFSSSDHTDAALHPKIVITYDTTVVQPDTCFSYRISGDKGFDSDIRDDQANIPNPASPDFIANAWTVSGNPFIQRSLINLNLPPVPMGTVLVSARLSLFANPTTGHLQHHSGANECYLKRITSPWNYMTVCWNNQPTTTTTNQVIIPQSTAPLQDYPDIDITQLVADTYNDPLNSHGLMMMLVAENQYAAMIFASSDNADTSIRPTVELCFTHTVSQSELAWDDRNIIVFPNPARNFLNISMNDPDRSPLDIEIFDVCGKCLIMLNDLHHQEIMTIDIGLLPPGVYLIKVAGTETALLKRFIIN